MMVPIATTNHRRGLPFEGDNGEVVIIDRTPDRGWFFKGAKSGACCGMIAEIADLEISAKQIARERLGDHESRQDHRDLMAALIFENYAFLNAYPAGSRVSLWNDGTLHVRPQDPDWLRAASRDWAERCRAEGHLPLLVLTRSGWHVMWIQWSGSMDVIDMDELHEAVVQFRGYKTTTHIEVL